LGENVYTLEYNTFVVNVVTGHIIQTGFEIFFNLHLVFKYFTDMASINKNWIPQLIFSNTLDLSSIIIDLYSSLTIQRQGEPSLLPPADLTENYIFKGSENPLMYNDTYDLNLHCNFLLVNYPFDTQKCTIKVITTFYEILGCGFTNI
jgi:hypothetical protein